MLKSFIGLLVYGLLAMVQIGCSGQSENQFDEFAPFSIERDTGSVTLPKALPVGVWKGLLVVKFNSDCHMCCDKMNAMIREEKVLDEFAIVLISSEEWPAIKSFEMEYQLTNKSNYLVGQTNEEDFYKRFNAVGAPFTAVFNERGEEVYRFDGNASLLPILRAFFE
ncbi:MAG: hypothetical protein J4F31_01345 [Flavobacteriales bacterium]|nr:hypothetical protein [Flavobacteriales bacterium]